MSHQLYCAKCRDELGHRIARFKASPDDYRRVEVVAALRPGTFRCRCLRCGHEWTSKSAEASARWAARDVAR